MRRCAYPPPGQYAPWVARAAHHSLFHVGASTYNLWQFGRRFGKTLTMQMIVEAFRRVR